MRILKAAICYGLKDIRIENIKLKDLEPDDVLIKIAYCGVCPSDVRVYEGLSSMELPAILGHEYTGWIEKVGENVHDIKVGTRVAVDPGQKCYTRCEPCKRGYTNKCKNMSNAYDGFAEYHVTRRMNVYPLKDETSMLAAALSEPLACVVHGQKQAKIKPGSVVVVIGTGPIGLLHIQTSKYLGAKVIASDVIEQRLKVAKEIGADVIVNSSKDNLSEIVAQETEGSGTDAVIIAVGRPEIVEQGVKLLGIGGNLVIFAGIYPDTSVGISPNLIHYEEINITGSSDYTDQDFIEALRLIEEGHIDIEKLVTNIYPLEEVAQAMEYVRTNKGLKVVIDIGANEN